jgi:hypothetical protein
VPPSAATGMTCDGEAQATRRPTDAIELILETADALRAADRRNRFFVDGRRGCKVAKTMPSDRAASCAELPLCAFEISRYHQAHGAPGLAAVRIIVIAHEPMDIGAIWL